MIAAELLTDLAQRGIRLEVHGDRLRYSPRSAVTPDLAAELKRHKGNLLAILRSETETPVTNLTDAKAVWQAAAESADDSEPDAFGRDGWPLDSIDPDELDPCPECGTLELWQTLAGNWRCLRCDPPTTSRRLLKLAARMKRPNRMAQDLAQRAHRTPDDHRDPTH